MSDFVTISELEHKIVDLYLKKKLFALSRDNSLFPYSIKIKSLKSAQIAADYTACRQYTMDLLSKCKVKHLPLQLQEIPCKLFGPQKVPSALVFDDYASLIQMSCLKPYQKEIANFAVLHDIMAARPELEDYIVKNHLALVEIISDFKLILRVVDYLRSHKVDHLYVRQVALDGMHTKFIEKYYARIADIYCLYQSLEDRPLIKSFKDFEQYFHFKQKENLIKLRSLDESRSILGMNSPLALSAADINALKLQYDQIFIFENETTFWYFPAVEKAIALYGGGYGSVNLVTLDLMQEGEIYYCGDLDLHGFDILNDLRARLKRAFKSIFMDIETYKAHESFAVMGASLHKDLPYLNAREQECYKMLLELKHNRLEQEFIPYAYIVDNLKAQLAKVEV